MNLSELLETLEDIQRELCNFDEEALKVLRSTEDGSDAFDDASEVCDNLESAIDDVNHAIDRLHEIEQ